MIYLLFSASSADKDKVLASNGGNATNKNWEVKYYESNSNITGFTGTIVVFLVMDFAVFVANYTKKPKRKKRRRVEAEAVTQKAESDETESSSA